MDLLYVMDVYATIFVKRVILYKFMVARKEHL